MGKGSGQFNFSTNTLLKEQSELTELFKNDMNLAVQHGIDEVIIKES